MLCLEKLEQLIKDEIKYNVKACNIKQDWIKDKEVISLDGSFKVYDIYAEGVASIEQLKRTKEIHYLIIRDKFGMWLSDTKEGHFFGAYRSRQTNIWEHYKDINKLGEEWWTDHLEHYSKRYNRFKTNMSVALNYKRDLEHWLERGKDTNHFTPAVEFEFHTRITAVDRAISNLKEKENADNGELLESTDQQPE